MAGMDFAPTKFSEVVRYHAQILLRCFREGGGLSRRQGIILPSFGAAKDRALAIVRKLETTPRADDDLVCTVRDVGGRQLLQIRIQAGKPVVSLEE
ncbi:hypothetical protein [Mesorhizobium sp.]|uniref:DUF6894 family protein n=1 Tax=Mesorhizobium sp. TaxID=1871066 RepID=UPI000FE74A73|nr:hypothetical protein [Mesorhizobium sp.]RWE31959.1 MAG: hypothetical protein EOS77_15605 [Mesorhizobium sp.]